MQSVIDRWEHMMVVLDSPAEPHRQFLQQRWPTFTFPAYTPFALLPQLDMLGQQGWELVSLQPVVIGQSGDVLIAGGDLRQWTTKYLCTFKRRIIASY